MKRRGGDEKATRDSDSATQTRPRPTRTEQDDLCRIILQLAQA
jgi:hypothetical protein